MWQNRLIDSISLWKVQTLLGTLLYFIVSFLLLQKFGKDVEHLLGPKGVKLFERRKDKSFIRQVDELATAMRGFQKEPGNLKEYSPWLSAFKADAFSNELEVPGPPAQPPRRHIR